MHGPVAPFKVSAWPPGVKGSTDVNQALRADVLLQYVYTYPLSLAVAKWHQNMGVLVMLIVRPILHEYLILGRPTIF